MQNDWRSNYDMQALLIVIVKISFLVKTRRKANIKYLHVVGVLNNELGNVAATVDNVGDLLERAVNQRDTTPLQYLHEPT